MTTFVDCFSSLDDVPAKKRGNAVIVLRALSGAKRFSCFEVDRRLGGALDEIKGRGWAKFDHEAIGYPWIGVEVTEAGRSVLADQTLP